MRSLSYLLTDFKDVKQIFVSPPELHVPDDVIETLKAKGVEYTISSDLQKAIKDADAVYMTRIQDEWDSSKGASAKIDTSRFRFGSEELKILKKDAIIMHPLPRREEIATCCDNDPRAMYWRQMRNGMWIRAALIAATFGYEREIMSCGF